MGSSIHLLTSPTADTPGTTLILQTQRQHYIFGSHAEGTQRAMTQVGTRMTKVQDFFLTGKMEWGNMGGMIGLALTMADAASSSYTQAMEVWRRSKAQKKSSEPQPPKLNIYGPPNLKHTLATCRRFIFRRGVPIIATEFTDKPLRKNKDGSILPSWQDEHIQVWALPVAPPQAEESPGEQLSFVRMQTSYDSLKNDFEEYQQLANESPEDRELRYDSIRSAVLGFMFNSDWNFDTLVEHHISEVEKGTVMFVRNPDTHRIEPYSGPKPGGQEPLPDIKVLTRTPWPAAKIIALPPTKPAPESISYIVRAQDTRGMFDPKRAKQLGLKPGPLFGKLSAGMSITNENGETITPDMVIGPDRPGQGVAIFDLPSVDYVEALIQREELHSEQIMGRVKACFWILGPGVSKHPTLRQFMQKLDQVEHVISSVDDCPNGLTMDSVAAQTTRLGQIDPARYHVPFFDNETLPQKSLYGLGLPARKDSIPQNSRVAIRGLGYTLMPNFEPKTNPIPPQVNLTAVKEKMDPDIIELAKVAQQEVENDHEALHAWRQLLARPDAEVITLGTGSALPSKYRNVSATLLRVPGVGNYLFDCGENTLGQLQRVFNPDELVDVLKNLRVIWISHLHADHHLGIASVIKAWYKIVHNSVPVENRLHISSLAANVSTFGLSVISHEGILKWLREFSSVEDFGFSRILPIYISAVPSDCSTGSLLTLNVKNNSQNDDENVIQHEDYETILGLTDIQACDVRHCHGALAVSMTFPQSTSDPQTAKPFKVSYSGDCRPSRDFARIGKDSTVLIHEATFDDELQGDAIAKKHSTTSEALGIGTQMDAKAVVLTHFSQRYQKIPVLQTVQDGEQEDQLLDPNAMEDVQQEEGNDDTNPDNMDATASTNITATSHPRDHSTNDFERVIKIKAKDMKVAIAFDYMRVKVGEIAQLEKFNGALEKLLAKQEKMDEGDVEQVNANGKKVSGDEGGGKKKKYKRNN